MTNQKKIQVGEVYTVKDVEADPSRFIGAEIKVCWTPTSFAQMTLGRVSENDYGSTEFVPFGEVNGRATVYSDMRVEVLDLKVKDMPTVKGSVVRFGEGRDEIILFTDYAPRYPGDGAFREINSSRLYSWTMIKAKAAGRPIFVSEPSWEKVGE